MGMPVASGAGPGPHKRTKGERTRESLLQAAMRLLERDGYHALKVTDIAPEAGLAVGIFYRYFKDKDDVVLALFDDVVAANMAAVFAGDTPSDPFEAILQANRRYVQLFANGGGLNRAIGQIADTLPEARARWQRVNAEIGRRIAKNIAERAPQSRPHQAARVFAALAVQAMLDTVLLQTFAHQFPEMEQMRNDPERLAQALSILWSRALFGVDPAPGQVPQARDFLSSHLGRTELSR